MARTLAELNVVIGVPFKKFELGLKKVENRLNRFSRKMSRLGSDLTHSVTLPLAAAGAAAVVSAVKFEKLRVQLDVLTGSAKNGAIAFERLVQFAAVTPFRLDQLVRVNRTLLGFGLSSDAAFGATRRLADIAALADANMDNLAVAFGQAAAEGRVMTRDIRQFVNNGVPMIRILADSMGVLDNQILDLAKQGKISFAILDEAFRKTTAEGGLFFEGTKKLAQTLGGIFSTFQDNVSIALAELGKAIAVSLDLKVKLKALGEVIFGLVEKFKSLEPETQKNIVKWALITATVGPALIAISKMTTWITALVFALKLLNFCRSIPWGIR